MSPLPPPPDIQHEFDKNQDPHETNLALRRLYPQIRERENERHIPRRWDLRQASSYLDISQSGYGVTFKKNVTVAEDKDPAGVVRADAFIQQCIGVYYFEVRILEGHSGCMGIGLSKKDCDLNRMPGWDPGCFGYHGDDGNFFLASGVGQAYGPKFGPGDVIGCGIDTFYHYVFFTKNGKHLGIAHTSPTALKELYPTVGFKTRGEKLVANFGVKPFEFDFEAYRQHLMNKKIHLLENIKMPENFGKQMNRIVSSFLGTTGALATLQKFEETTKPEVPIDHEYYAQRKEITDMILKAARGAEIHEKIEKYFPGLVEDDANVHLLILCLRYIDLANTLHEPPNCFTNSTTGRSPSPTEIRARPPKLLKGSQCKTTKRTREAQRRSANSQVHTPPPVRLTNAKATEELYLKDAKIERFYIDQDTEEEMLHIDGVSMPTKMFVELEKSGQYRKLNYILKMGREIMKVAGEMRGNIAPEARKVVEIATSMVSSPERPAKHPLSFALRRFIANSVVDMICYYVHHKREGKSTKRPRGTSTGEIPGSSSLRMFSELRNLFTGWKGLHIDYSTNDKKMAGIHFVRKMILEEPNFNEKEIIYTDEPMELAHERPDPPPREIIRQQRNEFQF
ncbi:B30.2/SPRY domain-containing protein [Caenorhabditis elegans]|uniref:B30.2/SPRY domain-containing protein n=5 Tax=Caenorhabditis elegans TaxID=6239 RepID=Q9XWK4_CAEEL|nr:B30.2/SPRY domain-containing protein [Caenorhabditis elegans]CAA21656.1 B30.2/SPRY domain-containing protein [Caenorhabditis elegans]|eukprot:NP_001252408.1 Uncharacterized protein CELE_Y54E5A.7 [Caenorhabditis elegans]